MKALTLTIEIPEGDDEVEAQILSNFAETCIPASVRGYTFRMSNAVIREVEIPSWDDIAVAQERAPGEHPGSNVVSLFPHMKPVA